MIGFLSNIYWAIAGIGPNANQTVMSDGGGSTTTGTGAGAGAGVSANTDGTSAVSKTAKVLNEIRALLDDMIMPFLYVVGAAGMIYGIWLGVSYARSEGDARAEAKKRIINFLIGFVCIIVLLVLLALFVKYGDGIVSWLDNFIVRENK